MVKCTGKILPVHLISYLRMNESTPIKLSELTNRIRETLNRSFGNQYFWVFADITDYNFKPDKNYHYFELVEKGDQGMVTRIRAGAWGEGHLHIRQFEKSTGQLFKNGIHVLLKVTVDYHILHGLRLTLIDIDTSFTLGELEKQKAETIRRLLRECPEFIRMEGDTIITRNKGHLLKPVIQQIAVVSSKQSAGYEDFMHTLKMNGFGYTFFIDPYFSSVQGESNADEIFNRLIEVFQSRKEYDAVVIIRGGGSEMDFLIFNQYNLGRIVAKFPVPIITGIGHQKNETIVDLMAHTSTKTPTKSAEFIIAHNRSFEDRLVTMQKVIIIKSQQVFSLHQQVLTQAKTTVVNKSRDYIARYLQEMVKINRLITQNSAGIIHARRNEMVSLSGRIIAQPRVVVGNRRHEIEQLVANISTFRNQYLKNIHGFLNHYVSMIRLASPQQTLKRGFALVKIKGRIITDPGDIRKGEEISVILQQTEILSTVTGKKENNGSADNL
jgi:exodeoxyribonuclease VII large subunit